jgi:lactoylglutathione lyase
MLLSGITHLAVTAKDMEKSLDFYTRVLGLKKVFDIPEPGTGKPWIVYLHLAGKQFVELFYNGTKDNPWEPSLRGFNHICFVTDDIQALAAHIESCSWKLDAPPKKGVDNNWQCWVTDPAVFGSK